MNIRLLGLLIISSVSLLITETFAQECPSSGTVKIMDSLGQSIELSIENSSNDIELNIFDSDRGVYIYSESKLDPGFYVQENLKVDHIGQSILITGFEVPYSESRFKIVVMTKDCKPLELAIKG